MHILRLQQEIHAGVGHAHQIVGLLKNTGAHVGGDQLALFEELLRLGNGVLPQGRVGALARQVGDLHGVLPLGDIRADLVLLGGEGIELLLRPGDGDAPGVLGGLALDAVAPGQDIDGVLVHNTEGLVVVDQAVGLAGNLQGLLQIFNSSQHGKIPP